MNRRLPLLWIAVAFSWAQDPFQVAPKHYKLALDNAFVRVSRVTYEPDETAALHDHPDLPTIFIYTTDGGRLRLNHSDGRVIIRPAVKAGGIRFSGASVERHSVESLGGPPSEYLRIELKTEPLGRPATDVRLAPEPHPPDATFDRVAYENGQVRIVRAACAAGAKCLATQNAGDPSVTVFWNGKTPAKVVWSAPGQPLEMLNRGPDSLDAIRIEVKKRE